MICWLHWRILTCSKKSYSLIHGTTSWRTSRNQNITWVAISAAMRMVHSVTALKPMWDVLLTCTRSCLVSHLRKFILPWLRMTNQSWMTLPCFNLTVLNISRWCRSVVDHVKPFWYCSRNYVSWLFLCRTMWRTYGMFEACDWVCAKVFTLCYSIPYRNPQMQGTVWSWSSLMWLDGNRLRFSTRWDWF